MTTHAVLATVADAPSGARVDARTDSGFELTFDSGDGAARAGASPMETVLAALAACTSRDVVDILRKKRQTTMGYQIEVRGERSEEHPRVYTSIVVEHRVTGDVEPEALRRSIELSATRYCPVNAMLSARATVEHRYLLAREVDDPSPRRGVVVVTGPRAASPG